MVSCAPLVLLGTVGLLIVFGDRYERKEGIRKKRKKNIREVKVMENKAKNKNKINDRMNYKKRETNKRKTNKKKRTEGNRKKQKNMEDIVDLKDATRCRNVGAEQGEPQ